MLWEKVHKGRASRLVSTMLSALLVSALVSPGVAVFAGESTSTPVPDPVAVQPAPVPEPVPVPAEVVLPVEQPINPVIETAPVKDVSKIAAAPVAVSAPLSVPAPGSAPKDSKSVESPVTVAAAVSVLVSDNNGGGPRSDFPDPITVGAGCDLTTIAIFWAGQNFEAGTVSASNDADNIYVTFTTTGGWTMGLTHLYVGLVPPASYAPGSFPYQTTHDPAVTSYTYTIALADLGAVAGDTIYIAAHAEVSNGEQSETAWAGTGQWPGLLFGHVVQECVGPEPADLTVIKFNDLNGNGEMDEGEPVLAGIDITATMGELVLTETTDENGKAVFVDLADGTYTIDEVLPAGWVATTELPFDVSVVAGQDLTVHIGNMEVEQPVDVVKTFRLIYPLAPAGVTFFAGYTIGESEVLVELLGEGPFDAQVQFPQGTEITVSWYAMFGSELVLLGSGEPEILTSDMVNEFSYGASVSGFKFDDLDVDGVWDEVESGMGGWTISLYRE
ncbi:hypothetical protein EG835_04850, partial [bacterium]|nr:hypothetical protein [bacterium]